MAPSSSVATAPSESSHGHCRRLLISSDKRASWRARAGDAGMDARSLYGMRRTWRETQSGPGGRSGSANIRTRQMHARVQR
eukprot:3327278-Pleurochrysis_carterae.AAC.1